jgi:Sec-independent protein translocase protein TatA
VHRRLLDHALHPHRVLLGGRRPSDLMRGHMAATRAVARGARGAHKGNKNKSQNQQQQQKQQNKNRQSSGQGQKQSSRSGGGRRSRW